MNQAEQAIPAKALDERHEAFVNLVKRHEDEIFRSIITKVIRRDEAKEILHDALALAWERFDQLQDENKFAGWLLSITNTIRLNRNRSDARTDRKNQSFFKENRKDAERLAESYNPEKRAMNAEEKRIAEKLLQEMPERYRVPYCHYHGSGLSMAEIAELEGISESTVRQRLVKAQKFLSFRVKRLVVGYLVFELFNTDVGAMTNDVLAQIGFNVPESETAATVGAAAGAGVAGKTWTATLAGIALAIVHSCWIFLLYASGLNAAKALVRETPTLESRRWLVRRLMIFYCAMLGFPLMFTGLDFMRGNLGLALNVPVTFYATFFSSLACLAIFAVLSVRKYVKICNENSVSPSENAEKTYPAFTQFIKNGVMFSSLLLILILLGNGYGAVRSRADVFLNPGKNFEPFLLIITGLATTLGVFAGLHFYALRLFRFFVKHSKDSSTFSAFFINTSEADIKERSRHEIVFIVPFLVAVIGSWLLHVLFIRNNIGYSTFETCLISGLWYWIWKLNTKNNSSRWIRITILIF